MRLHSIHIQNFRNFRDCKISLSGDVVIVGENKVGKSNLLHALRLVLDPRVSDADRKLKLDDFWDGLNRPLTQADFINISVEITDFENDMNQVAVLANYLVAHDPLIARLSYRFQPIPTLEAQPTKESDYDAICYGGESIDNRFGYDVRAFIPLTILPALRDAEGDLSNWRKSPLAPLLRTIASETDQASLDEIARNVEVAHDGIAGLEGVRGLNERITSRLSELGGPRVGMNTSLNFSPTEPNRLIRALKLFIDNGERGIGDASLGCANLIYLTLLSLDLQQKISEGSRHHTFLAIEEPEAHLHPHLQRLAFRDFFSGAIDGGDGTIGQTVLLTTHSPNIVSVAPINSLVVLSAGDEGTTAASTADLNLDESEYEDLARYLDVNRGECVFATGLLLVEGIAEEYLITAFAKLVGADLDKLGISICVVGGTNFLPYVKFFGVNGLNIPLAIVTDLDPVEDSSALALNRVRSLFEIIEPGKLKELTEENFVDIASTNGIFVNSDTLETELLDTDARETMVMVLKDLTDNGACEKRCDSWLADLTSVEKLRFMADLNEVGKGRFAQRLAGKLANNFCPDYILRAIEYITEQVA